MRVLARADRLAVDVYGARRRRGRRRSRTACRSAGGRRGDTRGAAFRIAVVGLSFSVDCEFRHVGPLHSLQEAYYRVRKA